MARRLTDIEIRYQVLLERIKAGEVQDFAKVFPKITQATNEVLDALDEDVGQITRRKLTEVLAGLRALNQKLLDEATADMMSRLEKLAGHAAEFEAGAIGSLADKLKLAVPTAAIAYKQALAQPISATGQLLEKFVSEWSRGETARLNNAVQKAWGEGWTNQQLKQAIRGTKALNFRDGILQTSRRNAEAIGRTAIQHVASTGRLATWEANKDIVTGYRWVSTLDSVTTQICRSLDGKVFPLGGGPVPPVHINCRSATVAVLDPKLGLDFLEKGATRSSADGGTSAKTTYYEWLKTQSPAFQKEALGATRAKLFASGGLSAEKFAALNLGRNFQPLTLDEMRTLAPLAFAKAGIPPKP